MNAEMTVIIVPKLTFECITMSINHKIIKLSAPQKWTSDPRGALALTKYDRDNEKRREHPLNMSRSALKQSQESQSIAALGSESRQIITQLSNTTKELSNYNE